MKPFHGDHKYNIGQWIKNKHWKDIGVIMHYDYFNGVLNYEILTVKPPYGSMKSIGIRFSTEDEFDPIKIDILIL